MKKNEFCILATLLFVIQGAWADTTVMTETDLLTAVRNNQTVTLGTDIALGNSNRLDINGTTVTLNLNGHTLRRSMTAADDGGQVIFVRNSGNLTVTDKAGNSGKITGGWAYQGGGIYVSTGCSLASAAAAKATAAPAISSYTAAPSMPLATSTPRASAAATPTVSPSCLSTVASPSMAARSLLSVVARARASAAATMPLAPCLTSMVER